jgi:hypothetical protein
MAQGRPISESSRSDRPRGASGAATIALARGAWIGAVGGLGVGLVMGVVNRIVMRIVALMNGPTSIETDFGAQVLEFTVGGTIFLVITTALFAIAPGVLYVGLRRFLPGGVLPGGLVFGVLLAAVFGTTIVDSLARDFRLLGEPVVSAAMFLGMFVLFGLLVAPVVARLDRRMSRDPSDGVSALYAAVTLVALLTTPILFIGHWSWLLVVPLGFAVALSVGERSGASWTVRRRLIRAGGYVALAVPLVPGSIDVGQELAKIVRA